MNSKTARIRTSCLSFARISSFFSSDVFGFFNDAWSTREVWGQAHIRERRDRTRYSNGQIQGVWTWAHLEACDDSLGVLLPGEIGRRGIRGGGPGTASRDTTTGPHSISDRLIGFVLLFLLLVSLPGSHTIPDGFLNIKAMS